MKLNRFWPKIQCCCVKRLRSIEEENRRLWLKLFFISEWIIVLKGTSQWLIQQEETASCYQLKGVSPLHLKQLISAAVRETSGIAQCGSSYPEKQTHPALYRKAEVCSCLQWQVDYVVCVSSFSLWCWVRCNQSANRAGQGFYEHQSNPMWQQVPCLVGVARAVLHLPLAFGWQSSVCLCSDPNLPCSVLSVWTWLKSRAD